MGLMLLRDHCESIRGTARKSGINGSYISAVRKGRVSKDVRTENWEKLLSALETYGGEVGRAWAAKRRPLLSPASLEASIAAPLDHPAYRLAAWLRDRPGETEAVVAYAAAMLGFPRTAGEPVRVSGRRATT